jgi:hypothetical protein
MNCLFLILFILVELSKVISFKVFLDVVKYIKIFGAIIMPDKKASSELLRGSILKVVYTDEEGEKILLLPFSDQKKEWIKVTALVVHQPPNISDDSEKEEKLHRKKINITLEILRMAGPGKDFFNLAITPAMINRDYQQMTFHYRKKDKIRSYNADELIKDLP